MAYNETNVMANFNEFEGNGQCGKYSDVQYYHGEMIDIGEQDYTVHSRTPTTPQGSKIPTRRSSIPLPIYKYESRKTTPVTQDKPAAQANDRKIKTPTQLHQKGSGGSGGGGGGRELPRVRSPEVRAAVISPGPASDGSEEVQVSSGTMQGHVLNQVVLEKLSALEDRLATVASETGLSGFDTAERLSVIQERINQLEDQTFKIFEEVAKQPYVLKEGDREENEKEEVTERGEIMRKLTLLEDKLEDVVSKNASQDIQTVTDKILEEVAGKTSILQDSMTKMEQKLTMSINRDIESMTKKLSEAGDKSKDLEVENAILKAQVAKMGDISKTTIENEERIRSLEQDNARLKMENSTKQQNVAKTAADKDERIRKLESEKYNLQREVGKLQISEKSLAEKEAKIKQLERETANLKTDAAQVQKLTTSVNQKDTKISELLKEMVNLKSKLSQAETKIAAQQEDIQKASAQLSANQAESEEVVTGKKSKKSGKFKLF